MRSNRDHVSTGPRRWPARLPSAARWGLALALCLAPSSPALAYCGAETDWLNFPQITVASDGDEYTGVTAIGYGWEGRVDIDCDGLARVKSWALRPVLRVPGMDPLDFALYKQGKSYPVGKRPQSVERTVGSTFPNVFVDDYATEACNRNLQSLMSQGLSRAQVLRAKRVVVADYWEHLDVDATIGDVLQQAHSDWHVDIVCDKSPFEPIPPGPGGLTSSGDFVLDNARLVISPSTYSGRCPKDLTLFMEVQGNHKGTVEARIESTEGWKSTLFTVHTTDFDDTSGLWGKEFSEPFTVPVEKPQGSGGGGGIAPGPGNFQAPSRPEEPVFPGSPRPQGPGGLTAKDPGPNVHKQSLRLVARANGKTVYSDWEQYAVTCDPKATLPPATTAFLPGGTGGEPPKPEDQDPKPGKPLPQPGQKPSQPSAGRSGAAAKESTAAARTKTSPRVRKASPAESSSAKSATPKPEPGAAGPGSAAGARPDLRVLQARRNAQSPNVIEFLVANGGKAAAGKTTAQLTCERAEGGFESWSAALPAIAASDRRWIKTSPRQAKPVRTRVSGCEIRLDPGNAVAESDEGNNGFSCAGCAAGPPRRH